jgi:hypothetical protein
MSSKLMTAMRLLSIACVALVGSSCSGADNGEMPAEHNTLTSADVDAGWQLLFDGETTDGWRGYNREGFPEKGWDVIDGNLVVLSPDPETEGSGGDIVTEQVFDNFELSLEFNVSPAANSGIFYRVIEVPGQPMWHSAPEYQVLDDSAHIEMDAMDMPTHLSGDNYDLHASSGSVVKPAGEWNHVRIIVNRGHVEHWLNGVKTVEYEFWSPDWEQRVRESKFGDYPEYGRATMGQIGLQDHGNEVWYRNIKIRPIRP